MKDQQFECGRDGATPGDNESTYQTIQKAYGSISP